MQKKTDKYSRQETDTGSDSGYGNSGTDADHANKAAVPKQSGPKRYSH